MDFVKQKVSEDLIAVGFAPSEAHKRSSLPMVKMNHGKKFLDAEPGVIKNVSNPPIPISLISQDKW